MRPFQLALLLGFAVIAILGLIVFATYRGGGETEEQELAGGITVWGTMPRMAFRTTLEEIAKADSRFAVVSYAQKDEQTFDDELLNALAEGDAPDLVVLSQEDLVTWRSKLYPLSYELIPQRSFQDAFIDGAEIFMRDEGVYGVPFAVDPMVLYWNKDLFATAGKIAAPATYEILVNDTVPALTRLGAGNTLEQSAVALGTYVNVTNAADILSLLMLQSGGDIAYEESGRYRVAMDRVQEGGSSGVTALTFFTQFSDPQRSEYSWSRTRPQDTQAFLGGSLALYFGFASEYQTLREQNPNLAMDVATVPQNAADTVHRTYAKIYAFAIPRQTVNKSGAYLVAQTFANNTYGNVLAERLSVAPARRSLLAAGHSDPVKAVFYRAAITARGWLNPAPRETEIIFKDMIENITSGRLRVNQSVSDGARRLEQLFQ